MADSTSGGGTRIGRMSVRIPGASREAGARVATQLEGGLASQPDGGDKRVGRIDLRVNVPANAGPELVAHAILRALRRRLA